MIHHHHPSDKLSYQVPQGGRVINMKKTIVEFVAVIASIVTVMAVTAAFIAVLAVTAAFVAIRRISRSIYEPRVPCYKYD